jgi:GTP-binding protein EngB required for normal cell division
MNYIPKSVASVSSLIGWSKDNIENSLLSNKEIIKIASILNNSHIETGIVDLPKLVVVGTQSSGKSSLLNAIIGLEILPIGKSMTTRTPLHLELIPTSNDNRIEFGEYTNCLWNLSKSISITYPNITNEQRDSISNEIEIQTSVKAGSGLNISNVAINIKIYANGVPNLSLVDLPGLTSVAITDRGQPKDIKQQIINLVNTYINNKNSIILAIIASRPDIEADMAMEVVKKADPIGQRTIGILTKLDLMNYDTDISNYLENNLSNDLKLQYGYFGIKNKATRDITIQEAIQQERSYFSSHSIYKLEKYQNRLGIPNLCHTLSNILIYNIKTSLPNVLINIIKKLEDINLELETIGTTIPFNNETRINTINTLINTYVKLFSQAIEHRGSSIQIGRRIKDTFNEYRENIKNLDPFNTITAEYVNELLKCYDGIHMSFPYLPMEILENTLRDKKSRPIFKLMEPSLECLNKCLELLNELNSYILENSAIKKYPNLIKAIKSVVINDIFLHNHTNTKNRIVDLISQEEAYIWTDNPEFISVLNSDFSKIIKLDGNIDCDKFKHILDKYFITIVRNLKENIPKAIVYSLVNSSIENLEHRLYNKIITKNIKSSKIENTNIEIGSHVYYNQITNYIVSNNDTNYINTLLEEFPEIEQRRKFLESTKLELLELRKLIESII